MIPDSKRFAYIDALRGVAILLVIMHHSHPYFAGISSYGLPPVLDTILANGDKGVTLFFLMSAFTLCLSLNSKLKTEQKPVRNYFIRRFFRIAPLYIFIIGVILLIKINAPPVSSVIANLFFVHGLNPNWVNSTVPGGWSVGIEVLFYLIFPVLFFRIKSVYSAINVTLACMVLAKIVTALMFRHPLINDGILWGVYTYENIISQLPVFLMGVCLFHLKQTPLNTEDGAKLIRCCCYIAAFIIIQLLGGNLFKSHYLFAIAFAIIAYGLSELPLKLLVNKATVWIGRISYSLYLIHLLVANLLVKYHFNVYSPNPVGDVAARFCVILAISTPLAYITYKIIEIPFQEMGKRLISRLGNLNKV
ncbi:acyltransferase [Mucilaginibacter sp.]|uniref:acyltransferase family protein n=1 Tax=Mucilaginibacter sp. TaxID=1882438 RepID=UPI003264B167